MTTDDTLDTANRLRLAIARLARRMRQQAGTGMTPSQYSALLTVDHHGPLTLGRLAKIEQIAPPTTTGIVGKLEDDGLVTRQVDAEDRRSMRVTITAEGRRRLDHSRERRSAWLVQRLEALDAARLDDVAAALRVLEALAAVEPDPDAEPDPDPDPGVEATAPDPAPDAPAPAAGGGGR